MFLKRFKRAHDAGRYFNQANEYWREAKQYVLEGKQKRADDSLVEVIRCCQLATECDERMGDAYILLSNALMNLANQMSEQAESAQHESLLSRAAAVIHFWHSLPYRNYPISKNAKIGEQLWRKVIQEIMQKESMSESTALSLLDSYRDSLAADTISPTSFAKTRDIVLSGSSLRLKNERVDLRSRLQRLDSLVEQLKNTAKQSPEFMDFAEFLDKYWSKLREVEQDITPQQLGELFTSFLTFLNAFNQSSHIELIEESPPTERNLSFSGFSKAQLEVILDSIIVVFLIGSIWKTNAVDSDDSRKYAVLVAKVVTWKLDSISSEPHISTSALGFSLWKLMTPWEGKPETKNPWLQETLEETLSPETWHFLKILPEVMQRRADKEQAPEDRLFRREKLLDSLKYEGKIAIADIEIMERIQKAFHNDDFREVIGWMGWLFPLLQLSEYLKLTSNPKEEKLMTEQGKFFGGLLNTTVHGARQAEDWHGLIMAIGLCELVGVREKSDEVLRFLCDRIGKEGIESRLREIERRPRMLIEDTIVNRIQRYLGLTNHKTQSA
ncbi:MAG: hypothetical protein A2Z77_04035 [Chloroflexi bacterium RBG_13_51_36]|nr:MAG: hypothetical protein A2Z77_04035 [Chloroflexi bacterium RBG_13_51_36]